MSKPTNKSNKETTTKVQTKPGEIAKQEKQSNGIIVGSKHSQDVAWSPDVPPGHTRYSWEQTKPSLMVSVHPAANNQKKEKKMTISVKQIMEKFPLDKKKVKSQTKTEIPSSQHLLAVDGCLRWGKKEAKELTKEEKTEICNVVDYSLTNQANDSLPRITQGLHDHYVGFCIELGRKCLFVDDFRWHTSRYLEIKSGLLELNKSAWDEEKIKSVVDLTENDALEFVEEVEHCIFERYPISKEIDSIYLQYCAAQNHQPMAQYSGQKAYEHGYRLLHGVMTAIDKKTAVHYIKQAAELDQCAAAYSLLGYCYQFGDGIEEDANQAIEYYQMAVDNGDVFGKIRLGRCYLGGIGVPKDEKKAHELFEEGNHELRSIADSNRADSNRALCLLHSQPAEH